MQASLFLFSAQQRVLQDWNDLKPIAGISVPQANIWTSSKAKRPSPGKEWDIFLKQKSKTKEFTVLPDPLYPQLSSW